MMFNSQYTPAGAYHKPGSDLTLGLGEQSLHKRFHSSLSSENIITNLPSFAYWAHPTWGGFEIILVIHSERKMKNGESDEHSHETCFRSP